MNKPGNNVVPIQPVAEEENPNRLPFSLEEMLVEFDNGQVPRSQYWRAMIRALYETANHVVTGVTAVADVKPDNLGNIPLQPTDINAPAMPRMDGADERERQSNEDVFGRQLFYDDACMVQYQPGAYYEVLSGLAYIAGIRFFYSGKQGISISKDDLPTSLWLDIYQSESSMSDIQVIAKLEISNQNLADYVDNGVNHWVVKIADVDTYEVITDLRNKIWHSSNDSTHHTVKAALEDSNKARDKISIGATGAEFIKVSEDGYNNFIGTESRSKFVDASGNYWIYFFNGVIPIEHMRLPDDADWTNAWNECVKAGSGIKLSGKEYRGLFVAKKNGFKIDSDNARLLPSSANQKVILELGGIAKDVETGAASQFYNGNVINGPLVIDMTELSDELTVAGWRIGYSWGNNFSNVHIFNHGEKNWSLDIVNALYTTDFNSLEASRIRMTGNSFDDSITTLNFHNLDCKGTIVTDWVVNLVFTRPTFQSTFDDSVPLDYITYFDLNHTKGLLVTGADVEGRAQLYKFGVECQNIVSFGNELAAHHGTYKTGGAYPAIFNDIQEHEYALNLLRDFCVYNGGDHRPTLRTIEGSKVLINYEKTENPEDALSVAAIGGGKLLSFYSGFYNRKFSAIADSTGLSLRGSEKDKANPTNFRLGVGERDIILLHNEVGIEPVTDNTDNLGTSSKRWKEVFSVNAMINTLDEHDEIMDDIPDSWIVAAKNIKQVRFKWSSEVESHESGNRQPARWHIGYGAQSVYKACQDAGITDPFELSFLCKDVLMEQTEEGLVPLMDEKTGTPKERWGLRVEELNTLKLAAIDRALVAS